MSFKSGDRVIVVRNEQRGYFRRYSNIEDETILLSATVIEVRGSSAKVKLDSEYKGWTEPVVPTSSLTPPPDEK